MVKTHLDDKSKWITQGYKHEIKQVRNTPNKNVLKDKIILLMCEYLDCHINSERGIDIKAFVKNKKL